MSISLTQQSHPREAPWVGTDPPALTLDGAGGQVSPTVAIGQLGPLVGERGGAPPAVAPQQDAAPHDQLPLDPALWVGWLLCGRGTSSLPGPLGATRGAREEDMEQGGAHLAQ